MKTAIKIVLAFFELKVENSIILTFKVIFLCQKSTKSFSTFFLLRNIKKEINFCYCHILITLIFNVVVFPKRGPTFQSSILKWPKGQKHFYGHFHSSLALLINSGACRKITLSTLMFLVSIVFLCWTVSNWIVVRLGRDRCMHSTLDFCPDQSEWNQMY